MELFPLMADIGSSSDALVLVGSVAEPKAPGVLASWNELSAWFMSKLKVPLESA
jgi:hypothetical protein